MCRLTEEVRSTVGLPRHRHFVGFFKYIQAPTRGQPFYGYSEKPTHLNCLLRSAWGYAAHVHWYTVLEARDVLAPWNTVIQSPKF